MQELRFVAVSEDGSYAVVAIPGRSARFTLPIDERLRAVALGQTTRLAQYEIEVESPLRPKEIQARIRAGDTRRARALVRRTCPRRACLHRHPGAVGLGSPPGRLRTGASAG